MKKHSILTRFAALVLAAACTLSTAAAAESTDQTEYMPVDGPSANSDLAYGSAGSFAGVQGSTARCKFREGLSNCSLSKPKVGEKWAEAWQ